MRDHTSWQADHAVSGGGAAVGQMLREARESLRIDIAQVAEDTRIRVHSLEAIEAGRFEDLPGAAYVPAFLRGYAERVGLDPERVLETYRAGDLPAQPAATLNFPVVPAARRAPKGLMVVASLLLLAGAYVSWHALTRDQIVAGPRVPDVPRELVAGQKPAEPAATGATTAPTPAAPPAIAAPAPAPAATAPTAAAPPPATAAAPPPVAAEPPRAAAPPPAARPATPPATPAPAPAATASAPAAGRPAQPPAAAARAQEAPAPLGMGPMGVSATTGGTTSAVPATPAAPPASATSAAAAEPRPPQEARATPATETTPAETKPEVRARTVTGGMSGSARVITAQADSWLHLRGQGGELLATTFVRAGDSYKVPEHVAFELRPIAPTPR
ncbi:MAG: helix-turn-helix domain-containing protein [Rhodospirillales bacterium]|nr:MAG: helix-turn-helix domain-containing protein [Rhodospirillales bacterium]